MTRASRYEILLASLTGTFDGYGSVSRDVAYEELRYQTGQDFGFDGKAWARWLDENVEDWRFETLPSPTTNILQEIREAIGALVWSGKEFLRKITAHK